MKSPELFIIDGHALCYRSFYAIKELSTKAGQPTNAVYGFLVAVRKILREYDPAYVAVCFDSKERTHRQEKFADYKIQRPSMPEELIVQIPLIKEALEAFNLQMFEQSGFEADDIIATLTKEFLSQGVDVVVVTEDKDMYQLASEHVSFLSVRREGIQHQADVEAKLGFNPKRMTDFIGLAGDSSDNIPGVTGIGKVNAKNLINKFGSLEDIITYLEARESLNAKERLIVEQKDMARLSKELAILSTDVPLKLDLRSLKRVAPNHALLHDLFTRLEFRRLADEFSPVTVASSVVVSDPMMIEDDAAVAQLLAQLKKQQQGAFLWIPVEASQEALASPAMLTSELPDLFDGGDKEVESIVQFNLWIALSQKDIYCVSAHKAVCFIEVFYNPSILKIVFDLKSVLNQLKRFNDENRTMASQGFFDVMLAGYVLNPSHASLALVDLSWTYLHQTLNETQPGSQTVHALWTLYAVMKDTLTEKKMLSLLEDIEQPLAVVLYRMEQQGVDLDSELLESLSAACEEKMQTLEGYIYEAAGETFNLNSPKQLSHILFEKLNLPVIKKTKTGYSTNEAVLMRLAENYELPTFIIEYRQLSKLKSTYIDALPKLINPVTGRIHASFVQTSTETGRLSSRNPNLQNIPIRTDLGRQIRKAIRVAREDHVMVAADYSQIELRILAHLSQDPQLLKAFKFGEDIHRLTASIIFDVAQEDVLPAMRVTAKRVNFGIVYGMSAFGLAKDLNISQTEAQAFIDAYFLRYPKVQAFMQSCIQECRMLGYVTTLLNRRRYIPEMHNKNGAIRQFAERQAINTPVQGSAADVMKLAMIHMQKALDEQALKATMLITVHDELVFEVPRSEKEVLVNLVREVMEHALKLSIPLTVSIKSGHNWLEMSEETL